jgi:hypothetical protein
MNRHESLMWTDDWIQSGLPVRAGSLSACSSVSRIHVKCGELIDCRLNLPPRLPEA